MDGWAIPSHQGTQRGPRREDQYRCIGWKRTAVAVTLVRPAMHGALPDEPRRARLLRETQHGAIRQRPYPCGRSDLPPVTRDTRAVQSIVHGPGSGRSRKIMSPLPCSHKALIICPAALATGSVTSGQRDGFVTEEQLGVLAWRHDRAPAVLERECTRDPVFMTPAGRAQNAMLIVKNASITHQGSAGRAGFKLAEGGNAILAWHVASILEGRDSEWSDILGWLQR
jgi:hypothetical protein